MAVTTSSGNGFALYNGVKLPNIDAVWTDRVKHPYAIVSFTMGVGQVSLLPEAFSYDGNTIRYTGMASYVYDPTGVSGEVMSEWMLVGGADSGTLNPSLVVWASYDIPNTANSSTFLSASEPIPLDGMNVIEWDGDTTGLASIGDYFFRIADYAEPTSAVCVLTVGTEKMVSTNLIIVDGIPAIDVGTPVAVFVSDDNASLVGAPQNGVYVLSGGTDFSNYVSLLAYTASGGDDGDDGDDEGDTAPALKHYCCINGTVYEIKSGTAKMGGTFCEVKSGTVLIDGTVYDFALN